MLRESKRGPFLSCSGYPGCKESFNLDAAGQPRPLGRRDRARLREVRQADGPAAGLAGRLPRLHGLPKCRNTMPVDDQGKPVAPVKVEVKCEKCGGPMGVKQGRRGRVPRLPELPQVPEHRADPRRPQGRSSASSRAAARGRVRRPDLKAIAVDETCENCGGPMTRPQGPPRLLPRLRQVPQVQGDQGAGRGDPGEDHGRHRRLSRRGASFAPEYIQEAGRPTGHPSCPPSLIIARRRPPMRQPNVTVYGSTTCPDTVRATRFLDVAGRALRVQGRRRVARVQRATSPA